VKASDGDGDRDWLARKIVSLRIFNDDAGVMNRSLVEARGELLAVSQFTLFASTRKGARPSYSAAAPPEVAAPMFDSFVQALERELGKTVAKGVFGADMQVSLVNDGPVTIWLDSANRE
jgi:D-tyrosyl-tRNA(Tyr) deacylase